MRKYLAGFFVGLFSTVAMAQAVPISFASTAIPVQAATDARYITYARDSGTGQWSVGGPVCPRADPTVITGISTLPCVEAKVNIVAPSGAFVTKLISDYKLVVLAAGYPSGD